MNNRIATDHLFPKLMKKLHFVHYYQIKIYKNSQAAWETHTVLRRQIGFTTSAKFICRAQGCETSTHTQTIIFPFWPLF